MSDPATRMQTVQAFVKRVHEMREAQKNYFRTRHSMWLERSKQLETLVDQMVADFEKKMYGEQQELGL